MQNQKNEPNTLASDVEKNGWLRRKLTFQIVSSDDIQDFPEMTERDLKVMFTGAYQLAQAVSYLAEMMDKSDQIKLEFVKDQSNILKVRVPSRHVSRTTYRCFLEYKPNSIGFSGLIRYYCECDNGSRTVGYCSHVAAIVYYLSHARYLSRILRPAEILSEIFKKTNHIPVIDSDSEED